MKLIQFYIPARHKPKTKWTPPSQCGKVLEFKQQLRGERLLNRLKELANGR